MQRAADHPRDMTFDKDRKSFDAYRKAMPGKLPTSDPTLSKLIEADEQAI